MRVRWPIIVGVALFALVAATSGILVWANSKLDQALPIPATGHVLEIPPGASLAQVAGELKAAGLFDRPRLLSTYGRLTDQSRRIQAGEYALEPGITARELLDLLVSGSVLLHSVTLVEGWTFAEALAAIREHPAVVATDVEPEQIMARLGKPGLHPEGQLLPETYRFPRGTLDVEICRQAHAALEETLNAIWDRRVDPIPLSSAYEALILASIIEKETGLDSERREIAGVFARRLVKKMRLQTDPTVIYGLGSAFDGDLRRRDLRTDTPYNTYTRGGLPPTPIALAGEASLRAAVDPAPGEVLYFVASGLGDGSHTFSETLEEHNEAVQTYLRRQRAGQTP